MRDMKYLVVGEEGDIKFLITGLLVSSLGISITIFTLSLK